jgi:hypothetical protein
VISRGLRPRQDHPNAPTQEVTLASSDGVIATAGIAEPVRRPSAFTYAAGLVTDELAAVAAALVTIMTARWGS